LNVVYQQVNVKLRLPTLMNKFFQAAPVSASDFVAHWRAIAGPPTKLQEVVSTDNYGWISTSSARPSVSTE
jgi:hypothetical protein